MNLAIVSSFMGAIKNRFISYQDDRSLEERLGMIARVQHVAGAELCYPQDFANFSTIKDLLKHYKLGVSSINFRSRRTGQWLRGSFSSHLASERREVVDDLKRAMDFAAELGCDMISTCPLNEGHDYIFEIDYAEAYDHMEETIGAAASYKPAVRIAIEYKVNDARARHLLGNAGETLAFCQGLGLPNVGVTLDVGHAIQGGERPAQSAVMLARAKRLFYVHLNDNDKFWDWDMIPGAYNLWDFVEFFYFLRKLEYDGWFAFDVFPKEIDTVDTYNVAACAALKLVEISNRLDESKVTKLLAERNPAESVRYLLSIV